MSVTGGFGSLAKFTEDLRRLPRVVAQKVATAAAPAITSLALKTFDAGEDPYGVNWLPGADGKRVSLRDTGALANQIEYVAIGTKLRVKLGVSYAKYQIGKRHVFPRRDAPLPIEYIEELQRVAVDVMREELPK